MKRLVSAAAILFVGTRANHATIDRWQRGKAAMQDGASEYCATCSTPRIFGSVAEAGKNKWQLRNRSTTRTLSPEYRERFIGNHRPERSNVALATAQRVELGRRLFFERLLSKDRSISCASCHQPAFGFAEPRKVSIGIGEDARRRNTPSVVNAKGALHLTWDGGAVTLEGQLRGVFSDRGDMGLSFAEVVKRLRASREYARLFREAYGSKPDAATLADAIASFERSLVFVDSRFDRYLFEGDTNALSAAEVRGWGVFKRSNCAGCHVPNLTAQGSDVRASFRDYGFHNIGVGYSNGELLDLGRYEQTSVPADWGAFLTPSLRNVELTAPYMHDGSIRTLEDVVDFYARGGIRNPNIDVTITPLSLTIAERADLVAFLRSLTSETLRAAAATHMRD